MSSLRTVLARHRSDRLSRREERALARALAAAPTVESAHELVALNAHR
jgi:hypothetical protein